jgi:type VI secretion system protein ImpJ
VGALAEGGRYQVETPRDGVRDANTGDNPRPVQFRRLNFKLLATGQDTTGYEVIPLAKVERSTMAEAAPELYPAYIPPLLSCDAWQPLKIDIVQQLYNRVSKLVSQRAKQVVDRRITFDSNSPGDRMLFEGLRVLNQCMAALGVLAQAEGIHPFPVYLELCKLVGQLAIFGEDLAAPELPRYNHDDLGECYGTVKRVLDYLLGRGSFELGYEEVGFVGHGLQMRVSMKPEWLAGAYQMFVGVASGIPTEECVRMLQGQLNMKIGASNRVEEIFKRGLMGLAFAYDSRPPRVLPDARSITYFRIDRNLSKDEWAFVQSTLSCAVRFNETLVDGTIQGQQDVSIRGAQGKTVRLRFTLYVVPPQTA